MCHIEINTNIYIYNNDNNNNTISLLQRQCCKISGKWPDTFSSGQEEQALQCFMTRSRNIRLRNLEKDIIVIICARA